MVLNTTLWRKWHTHASAKYVIMDWDNGLSLIMSWTNGKMKKIMMMKKMLQNACHFVYASLGLDMLTHWGWVTHICVGKLTIIGSDNGLSPGRRQAII